ncbi:hypothetical protein BST81_05705 [Leptolyngbya sp. 'hensonii']|uniref:CHAT domain-containing protein n=1 Tax=Leptolyngbya sp. 'hensonii' TaxID=1922337 RepID=UPI00094F80C0|nr:CHAT domain-containing tetratricopeptide repeat protein [Leptolyngbya sp. 'hensonii']OLP19256.1 hypothetical protein BST81_05705 [Leptolyngbya sp. 'hensonii']
MRLRCLSSYLMAVLGCSFLLHSASIPDLGLSFPAQAQSMTDRKAEADRLLQAGVAELWQWYMNPYRADRKSLPSPQKLERALALYQELKDRPGEVEAFTQLQMLLLLRQETARAIEGAQQRLARARQPGGNRSEEAYALKVLGDAYGAAGDSAQAIQSYQQSLTANQGLTDALAPWRETVVWSGLGIIALRQQKYPQAIEYFQKEVQANQRWQQFTVPTGSFPGLKPVQPPAASPQLGYALYKAGRLAEAQTVLQQWLNFANAMPSLPFGGFASSRIDSLTTAIGSGGSSDILELLLVTSGNPEQALEVSEQKRARALANLLNRRKWLAVMQQQPARQTAAAPTGSRGVGGQTCRNGICQPLKGTWRERRQPTIHKICLNGVCKMAQGTQVVREFVPDPDQGLVDLSLALSYYGQLLSGTPLDPPLDVSRMQQVAKTRQATLVQYSILQPDLEANLQPAPPTDLVIYVVQPTGKITVRRMDLKPLAQQRTSLARLVAQGQIAIGVRNRGAQFQESPAIGNEPFPQIQQPDLQQLHRWLIAPIADLLPSNPQDRVIVIPQGDLFLVPFAALQDPAGTYLIQRHTLIIAPSIQVLTLTEQLRRNQAQSFQGDVLIVGNPTMPKVVLTPNTAAQQLTQLPGAEKEAIAIGKLLQTPPLLGAQATKKAVLQRLSQARIIHLATHGLLYETTASGIPGVIALASQGQDSGLLTADEIFDLKLQAELVVLSACDTGGGIITGEGVIGLSRSLLAAGVPTVVVSLWKVPDGPTAELMTRFYRNLQTQPDKAQALRQAMLATMKDYPDPKAWAGFILIGEAN